jgi:8-amino-7-oxononanoate synthase
MKGGMHDQQSLGENRRSTSFGGDPPARTAWLDDALKELEQRSLRRRLSIRVGPQGSSTEVQGDRLIHFGSNDYLGLAADPRVGQAVIRTIESEGVGAGASPLVFGRSRFHSELEESLAEYEGTEAAIVFPSGFAANSGTIPALVGSEDAIYGDQWNHASIIDGCRLSRAVIHIYRHGDADHLRALLEQGRQFRRRLIVSDTLFSMEGDLAPLVELCELAERHDAMLMVDEAHATGVLGPQGRGVAEALGVEPRVDVRVGTLSKALGSAGGFVCGRRSLIEWLANRARSYVFSTASPAALAAGALEALRIVRQEPERRKELLERAAEFRTAVREAGWDTGRAAGHIVPLVVGEAARTMQWHVQLRQAGFAVPAIRPPSVPQGRSLLRVSLTARHTSSMIERLLFALKQLGPPSPSG